MLLRDVHDDDFDVLFEHWTDPDANRMAAFTVADPSDRAAFDARWGRLRNDATITTKTIELEGAVVGSIASWSNEGQREVTYWIGREHWGKGLATRALAEFLTIETTRPLYGVAAKDNLGSIRVLEKCGFRPIAESKGFANARGEETAEVIFELPA